MAHGVSEFVAVGHQLVLPDYSLIKSTFNSFLLHVCVLFVLVLGWRLFGSAWIVAQRNVYLEVVAHRVRQDFVVVEGRRPWRSVL